MNILKYLNTRQKYLAFRNEQYVCYHHYFHDIHKHHLFIQTISHLTFQSQHVSPSAGIIFYVGVFMV